MKYIVAFIIALLGLMTSPFVRWRFQIPLMLATVLFLVCGCAYNPTTGPSWLDVLTGVSGGAVVFYAALMSLDELGFIWLGYVTRRRLIIGFVISAWVFIVSWVAS